MTRGGKAIVGALIAIVLATVLCCGWYWLITCPSLHSSDLARLFCGTIRSSDSGPAILDDMILEDILGPISTPTPDYGPVATVEAYLTQTAEANK